jgi:DNA polymerase I
LGRHALELHRAGVPVVLAGDYNVVPTPQDIYPTASYAKNALVQPEARAAFQHILDQGWVDSIRTLYPDQPMYTFWDYMRSRWERDAGLRLDDLLLSAETAKRIELAGVDRDVRGEPNASDHAPAWIVLHDRTTARRAPAGGASANVRSRGGSLSVARGGSVKERPAHPGRPLLAIDGDSFAHRSYHALPKTILRAGGKQAGAIVGFANFLLRLHSAERPRAVLVGWDTLTAETYRHEQFPTYQSGREFDDALIEQLDLLPEFVAACGFVNAKAPGYEADDFLAAAVKAEERWKNTVLVASGDRDTFQLASNWTTILFPVRAGEMVRIGPAEVRERYGVEPNQVPDFIALRGDPSDKLPGAPGVGPKGAADLLRKYGTLEAALKAGRFATQAEALRLYRSIATMDAKAPLPALRGHKPKWGKAAALVRGWGLKALADRLDGLVSTNGGPSQ